MAAIRTCLTLTARLLIRMAHRLCDLCECLNRQDMASRAKPQTCVGKPALVSLPYVPFENAGVT